LIKATCEVAGGVRLVFWCLDVNFVDV
jgi:hypothetical protein